MAQGIVDTAIAGFDSCGSVLFLVDDEGTALHPFTVSTPPRVRRALKMLELPFQEHRYPIDRPENHIGRCAGEVRVIQGHDLAAFLAPAPSAAICRAMQRVVGARSFVALPVVMRRRLAGVTLHTFRHMEVSEALLDRLLAFNNLVATAIATCTPAGRPAPPAELPPKRELERLQDEFLALTAHELGSPLVAMKLMLAILTQDADLQEVLSAKHRRFFENLLGAAEQIHGMVNNIERALDFSRAGHAAPQHPVPFAALVEGVIHKQEVVAFASRAKITFTAAGDARELCVLGNPDHLEHALWELLANAIKHGGKGVGIEIALAPHETPRGRSVRLAMRDNGPGIPQRSVRQLGRRFYFGEALDHKSKPGLGLGLFVVRRIVAAHGGSVEIESKPGEGTAVSLCLPVARDSASGCPNRSP